MRAVYTEPTVARAPGNREQNGQYLDGLPHICGCKELAEFLVVDVKTVQGLAQRQEIPCRRVGKAYRFYRPAVLSWLLGTDDYRTVKK